MFEGLIPRRLRRNVGGHPVGDLLKIATRFIGQRAALVQCVFIISEQKGLPRLFFIVWVSNQARL